VRRREFITLLGGAAAAWPVASHAQTTPTIGFLIPSSPKSSAYFLTAFRNGLGEIGYFDGQNVAMEYRWAYGQYDRLSMLAADLAGRHLTLIVAAGTPSAVAVKAATATIPIIFLMTADPVRAGLVETLNRPSANITGVSGLTDVLITKRMELLRELVPAAATIGVLLNPSNSNTEMRSGDLLAAAQAIKQPVHILKASTESELDVAFATLTKERIGAVLVQNDGFFINRREQIVALAVQQAIPAIYELREFVTSGGLISYGASLANMYHLGGVYAGRILKGEKPVDLPVQQPTRFELVINLKTAKALGLTVPASLLARADEVIE
jgi:putative ABC transport system substrate-binding protein